MRKRPPTKKGQVQPAAADSVAKGIRSESLKPRSRTLPPLLGTPPQAKHTPEPHREASVLSGRPPKVLAQEGVIIIISRLIIIIVIIITTSYYSCSYY